MMHQKQQYEGVSKNKIFNNMLIFCIVIIFSVSLFIKNAQADENINISAEVLSVIGGGGGGNGGGGGGGYVNLPTIVNFTGRAYPLSKIIILQNGVQFAQTISGQDAKFNIKLSGLYSGQYIFSVVSEDNTGRQSSPFTFPLQLTQGVETTISGIFLSPTIDVDKQIVKQGEDIAIFGKTSSDSLVTISVHSAVESFVTTYSDDDGVYLYNFDTTPLELGLHQTKSKSKIVSTNEVSPFSNTVSFQVGKETKPKPETECFFADINCDGHINLIDFSIMTYWYKKPFPLPKADLDNNKIVNLADFSILAYYWNG